MKALLTLSCLLMAGFTHLTYAQDLLASHEFEARDISEVSLKGVFCDVYAEPGDMLKFKGRIEGRGKEGDYRIESRLVGDRVEIWVDSRGGRGWNNRTSLSKLEIQVPKGIYVRLQTTSGDIFARGLDGKELSVSSTSGDIELSDMFGPLEVTCTSGDVELDDVNGPLDVRTTSGDIEVSGIKGESEVGSTSGDLQIMGFEGDLYAHTTSGEIELRRGKGAMRFRTTSGDIDGYDLEMTGDMEVRASSGDIELELINDVGDLNFDLESSSGDLRVGRRSGEDEMYIKNGDGWWVKGVSSSGSLEFTN